MKRQRCEFHSHTLLSDGELLGIELISRAYSLNHSAIAVTDHVSTTNVDWVVRQERKECKLADGFDIIAIAGVEITHVPPRSIDRTVKAARRAGAEIVVVHGETTVEPVPAGTNFAAVSNPDVDILAHPGLITIKEAEIAKNHDVFLEVSSRRGHCFSNGHVARVAEAVGNKTLVNTDAHAPEDLLTHAEAKKVAAAAGFDPRRVSQATEGFPRDLLKRIGKL